MDRTFTKLSKYCKTMFLAFPRLAYLICNLLVMGKTAHVGIRNKPITISDLQQNFQIISIVVASINIVCIHENLPPRNEELVAPLLYCVHLTYDQ